MAHSLAGDMASLFQPADMPFTDVALVADDGTRVLVHKIVVAARSAVLRVELLGPFLHSERDELRVEGASATVLRAVVRHMYTEELDGDVLFESLGEVMAVALRYQLEHLFSAASAFAASNLTEANVIDMLVLADSLGDAGFLRCITDFVERDENYAAVAAAGPAAVPASVRRLIFPPGDVPDEMRCFSSSYRDDARYRRSRLHSPQAWSAAAARTGDWCLLDLGAEVEVLGVLLRGRADRHQRTTSVDVAVSGGEGGAFVDVFPAPGSAAPPSLPGAFLGNGDASPAIVEARFSAPTRARYVRITVASYYSHPSLRCAALLAEGEEPDLSGVPTPETAASLLAASLAREREYAWPAPECQRLEAFVLGNIEAAMSSAGWDELPRVVRDKLAPPGDVFDSARSSSSVWNNDRMGTGYGRGRLGSPQAWSAGSRSRGEWVQLDLGRSEVVEGVLLAGRHDESQWTTALDVAVSDTGVVFRHVDAAAGCEAHAAGLPGTFRGSVDRDTITEATFAEPVRARFVRLFPVEWHGHPSLRFAARIAPST